MKDLSPFIAAMALYVISPLLTRKAWVAVEGWIRKSIPDPSTIPAECMPDALAEANVKLYIEFASDLVQIWPGIILTSVGVAVALRGDFSVWWAVVWLIATVVAVLVIEFYVLSMSPQIYQSRKRPKKHFGKLNGCYSIAAILGFFINAVAVAATYILKLIF